MHANLAPEKMLGLEAPVYSEIVVYVLGTRGTCCDQALATAISEGALDSKLPHASIAASGKDNGALASLDNVRREQEAIGKDERRL
jgi:hypothetical protein